ncbi:hypothetical protein MTO96_042629 [Rhipicephalus appendiculatus]
MNFFFAPAPPMQKAQGDYLNNPFNNVHNGANGYRNSKVGWFLRKPAWKNIQLQSFEKNLYEEHPVTASRSMAEVDSYRKANGVSVRGHDVPKPILAMEESNFPDFVVEGIKTRGGHSSPTCIEAHCWPIALSGRNFLAIAETGSHKALAYVLPAVIHVTRQPPLRQRDGPIAVVVTPTPELAKQIHNVASHFAERAGKGCHICVATPRRLLEFLEDGRLNLHRCTYLVLDEVDRMVTMGFKPEVLKVAELCRPDRQTIIWITCWQKDLNPLVDDLLDDYVEFKFDTAQMDAENRVEMTVDICQEEEKEEKLAVLLDDVLRDKTSRAVVFADTKRTADEIAWKLRPRGWTAVGLHGKKTKEERHWLLSTFRNGTAPVLVTTDMAAQDLVLENVTLVVNYDCPDCSEAYARRLRHVARSGEIGLVHTFITPGQQRHARILITILVHAVQPVKLELYDVAKIVRPKRNRV